MHNTFPTLVDRHLIEHTQRQTLENELKLISICQELGDIAAIQASH